MNESVIPSADISPLVQSLVDWVNGSILGQIIVALAVFLVFELCVLAYKWIKSASKR